MYSKFKKNYVNYLLQSFLVFVCIALLLMLYKLFGGIIVASLGASSLILFVSPHSKSAKTKNVVGGYICGIIIGVLCSFIYYKFLGLNFEELNYILIFLCAAAAAIATFLMVSTNLVHAPAVSLAIGLSIDPECLQLAFAALIGIVILCVIRNLLKDHIKNLV